jgi:spore coat polysaccharide biosynthesis protein SpsF
LNNILTGLITVRTSSSRFPEKCLSRFNNDNTVIEHIINRTKFFGIEPIICTSISKSDDILEKIAIQNNIKVFRGSLDNKISRWYHCAKYFSLDNFHNIDADDPFFDGYRMKESLSLLQTEKLDYVKPSNYSNNGGATEGYSISTGFIEKVYNSYNDNNLDTEMAIYYFEKFNSNFKTMIDPEYSITINNKIPRLTLDYFEDYIFLNHLSFVVKNNLNRREIEQYLNKNMNFSDLNIHLNKLWKKKQLSKKI